MKVPPAEQRTASGSFSASGGSVSDYGALTCALNTFASANAQIYPSPPKSGGTAVLPVGKIASMLGQSQSRSLQQSQASFTGRITSDQVNVLLEGFETGPTFSASVGGFSPGVSGVHHTALLRRLNMVLYIGSTEMLADIKDESMPVRMRNILHAVIDNWREKIYPNLPKESKAEADQIHALNTEPLQILDRILEASTDHVIDGLSELASKAPLVHQSVNNWIYQSLVSSVDNFWEAFVQLASSLGMIYAPSFGPQDENGRLFGLKEAFDDMTTRDDVPAMQFQPSLDLPDTPVTHVVVPRVSSGQLRGYTTSSTLLPGQTVQAFVRYPENRFDGRASIMTLPPFVGPVFQSLSTSYAWNEAMKAGSLRSGIQKQETNIIVVEDALKKFLRGMAKRSLHRMQIQNVTANLTIPLDPSWEAGRAYEVGIAGEVMFRGLLELCQHSVSSSIRSPQAFTRLSFRYVQWGDFSVPFT